MKIQVKLILITLATLTLILLFVAILNKPTLTVHCINQINSSGCSIGDSWVQSLFTKVKFAGSSYG